MKKLGIIIILVVLPCLSFAMNPMSNEDLDSIVGASIIDPPIIAQQAGGDATSLNTPVAMTQKLADDIQTLTRPGTFANKVAGDIATVTAPAGSAQDAASGLSF